MSKEVKDLREGWLGTLVEGDQVAVCDRSYSEQRTYRVYRVSKITPTGRITLEKKVNGEVLEWDFDHRGQERLPRESGRGAWGRLPHKIEKVTDEIRENIRRTRLLNILDNVKWKDLDTKVLVEIVGYLP